jgi:tRNA-modifying protein YgfZ
MTKHKVQLGERGVLRVAGEDAAAFLQGLLTNDVESLDVGAARYAALLSPQGKILFDFLVLRIAAESGAAFLIDCPAAQTGELAKRLGFYRLRAKVAIADESGNFAVLAFWDEGAVMAGATPAMTMEGGFFFADPRDSRLGVRAILPREKAEGAANGGFDEYEAHRIKLGVPSGGVDFAYAVIFPHDANFDLLHGVDFEKGCYVGQEVVSRMRHRGGARKRIVRLTFAGAAPARGAPVLAGETAVGTLGSAADGGALALVRLDRVEDARAAGRALTAGGVAVEVEPAAPG